MSPAKEFLRGDEQQMTALVSYYFQPSTVLPATRVAVKMQAMRAATTEAIDAFFVIQCADMAEWSATKDLACEGAVRTSLSDFTVVICRLGMFERRSGPTKAKTAKWSGCWHELL